MAYYGDPSFFLNILRQQQPIDPIEVIDLKLKFTEINHRVLDEVYTRYGGEEDIEPERTPIDFDWEKEGF